MLICFITNVASPTLLLGLHNRTSPNEPLPTAIDANKIEYEKYK
jgi:hypothetical protein